MNVYLYCDSDEKPCSHFPRLHPFFIPNGVDYHCGQQTLVNDVHGADKSCVKHDAPYQENEYYGKLSMCSDNNQFWIWYCLILTIFQAMSCCCSGILNGWKVHSWLILGLRTCICFSSRDVCLLQESLIPPECLLLTRPGSIQHKLQRNIVQFYNFFFNVSVVLVFCIFASSDFLEKRKNIQCTEVMLL